MWIYPWKSCGIASRWFRQFWGGKPRCPSASQDSCWFSWSHPTSSEPGFSPYPGGHHPPPDQAQENCLFLPGFLFIWYFHPVLQFTETGKERFGIFFGKWSVGAAYFGMKFLHGVSTLVLKTLGLFFREKNGFVKEIFLLKKSILLFK